MKQILSILAALQCISGLMAADPPVVERSKAVGPKSNGSVDYNTLAFHAHMRLVVTAKPTYVILTSKPVMGGWIKAADHVFNAEAEPDANGQHSGRVDGTIRSLGGGSGDATGEKKDDIWYLDTKGKLAKGIRSETEWPAPANADRTRSSIGVGEVFTVFTVPLTNAAWTVSGQVTPTGGQSGKSITLTATDTAGTATVTASFGGGTYTKEFKIVAPASEKALGATGRSYAIGLIAVGMDIKPVEIHPMDVNFGHTWIQESVVGASATSGCFGASGDFAAPSHDAGAGALKPIKVSTSNTLDEPDAAYLEVEPYTPAWKAGGFTWAIPLTYRVNVGAWIPFAGNATANQVFNFDAAGTGTVTKSGQQATRPVGQAASSTSGTTP